MSFAGDSADDPGAASPAPSPGAPGDRGWASDDEPSGGRPRPTDGFGRPLASWGARALAILLDGLVLAVPNILIGLLLLGTVDLTDDAIGELDGRRVATSNVLGFALPFLYKALMEARPAGQTLGKMVVGIQVRDAHDGGPVPLGSTLMRSLLWNGLFTLCVLPGVLNALSPLWHPRRQAWHDRAARTVVISLPR